MISFGCFLPHLTERGTDHGYGHFPLEGNGSSVLHGLDSSGKTRVSRRQPVSGRQASATYVSTHATLGHKHANASDTKCFKWHQKWFCYHCEDKLSKSGATHFTQKVCSLFHAYWILAGLPRDVQLFLLLFLFVLWMSVAVIEHGHFYGFA